MTTALLTRPPEIGIEQIYPEVDTYVNCLALALVITQKCPDDVIDNKKKTCTSYLAERNAEKVIRILQRNITLTPTPSYRLFKPRVTNFGVY